ncbi:MAG: FlgD immunoglobulin-like domain containing protein [Elusimicrobiota bacterium]
MVFLCGDDEYIRLYSRGSKNASYEMKIGNSIPNPFYSLTRIFYQVPLWVKYAEVTSKVYDLKGRLVRKMDEHNLAPGDYYTFWDGTDEDGKTAAAGAYFFKVEIKGPGLYPYSKSSKIMLLK